jgi:Histidine phosphatase superfamily (branch 1)
MIHSPLARRAGAGNRCDAREREWNVSETMHGEVTLGLVHELHDRGIERMTVLIRHGARHYDNANPQNEPYMPLTEEGKADAYALGLRLPAASYRFFSSALGRCIETAYQVEKGCIARGAETKVNAIVTELAPFYVTDFRAFVARYIELGPDVFFRSWLDGDVDEGIMLPPDVAADMQRAAVMGILGEEDGAGIDVAVTHDWNIYIVQELCLGQRFEQAGDVGFLEGVVFYRENGAVHVANPLGMVKALT